MHGRADLNIWEYRLVFWDNASGAAYVMDTLRQDRFSVEPWVTVSAFGASLHQTPESAYNAVSMGVAVEKPEVTGYTAYLCEENFQPFVAKASSPDAFTDSLICREIGWSYANGPGSYYFFNTNLPRMPSRRVTNMVWADILTSPIRHQRLVGYADVWAPMPIILGQTFLPLIKADSSTPEPPPPPLVK